MEIAIAAAGILVTGLVIMGMILATPAGAVPASRANEEAPEARSDAGGEDVAASRDRR